VGDAEHPISKLEGTFKRAASTLKKADIPFMLGGGLACWARGGPETYNDLDLFVKPEDAERALDALVGAGMRPEHPPEDWLVKAWDDDVLVDLIFHPLGMKITDETLGRADDMNVAAIWTPVMALDDVIVTKLLALDEHSLDYGGLLQVARSLREQISWPEVRSRTADSPFARTFFTLLAELGIVTPEHHAERAGTKVRVLPGGAAR
jgi:hypothetical protein